MYYIDAPIAIKYDMAFLCLKPKDVYKLVSKVEQRYYHQTYSLVTSGSAILGNFSSL